MFSCGFRWTSLIIMNNATPNKSLPLAKCRQLVLLFQIFSVDILILQIYYIFTACAIIVTNSLLLNKFVRKKPKTRPDKLFVILTRTDLGVGLFSIPLISLSLFIKDFDFPWMFSPLMHFFVYSLYGFSRIVLTITALDRIIIIMKGSIYENYITLKILYCSIAFILLLVLVGVISITINGEFLERIPPSIQYAQLVLEPTFIIVTIAAYIYLLYFVRSKSRSIANARHGSINVNKKLMMTITYIYVCLILFNIPHYAGVAVGFIVPLTDPIVQRNLAYWNYILGFSNAYANALIILYNSRTKKL